MNNAFDVPYHLLIKILRSNGWEGFHSIGSLTPPYHTIPEVKGVYVVLCDSSVCSKLLPVGTGGRLEGKNLNYKVDDLTERWLNETAILYFGKAGGANGTSNRETLRSRLGCYLKFGNGKNVPHRGGRSIWQLKNSRDLILSWKRMPNGDPRHEEKQMIHDFRVRFHKRPFANRVG